MKISEHDIEKVSNLIKTNYRKNLTLGIILIMLGVVGIVFGDTGGGEKGIYLGAGVLAAAIGLYLLLISFKNPSKHKLIIWLSTKPEEIVWLYEISGKQNGVRFLKENGKHVFLEITGPNKQNWLQFFHQLLPNAYFGYDEIGKSRIKNK